MANWSGQEFGFLMMVAGREIIHVDMDAFFASVEQLDDPKLRGKAVIVGGSVEGRGVVSAASYEARKFGVHSAMPMARAVRLCPAGVVVRGRMDRYVEISKLIREIFYRYTPLIEPLSLDEAFLDVTGSIQLFGSSEVIGRRIKEDIENELGLVASVGIASNKFLAKLASDLDKPDGFVIIKDEDTQQVLDPLPISRIWGIGKVTEKNLLRVGVRTIKQLREIPLEHLRGILGNQAEGIQNLAMGIDCREVESERGVKSISSEETFATDVEDKDFLLGVMLAQVEEVSQRLRKGGFEAKTITLKLRYGDFRTITRSSSFDNVTNTTEVLWQRGREVFEQWYRKSKGELRLLGFGVSGLVSAGSGQKGLFTDAEVEKQKRIDEAYDKIKGRYGDDAVKRGRSEK